MSLSKTHQELQLFLFRNKLNEKSIMDLLPKLLLSTIQCIISDLDVKEKVEETENLYIFTDGNCKSNGKKNARAGYSIFFTDDPDSPFLQFNKTRLVTSDPTNNKAELSAIKYVFKVIYQHQDLFKKYNVIICTDSKYSIDCVTKWSNSWIQNNWKNSKG